MSNEIELLSVIGLNLLLLIAISIFFYLFYVRKGINLPEQGTFNNFFQLMQQNLKLIMTFDQEYYENFCGADGYQYLYFLKSLFKMQFVYLIIGIISIFFLPKKSGLFIIDQEFTPQYQFYMTLINCIMLLLFVYNIKNQLKSYEEQTEKSLVRQHSVIIQGIKLTSTSYDIQQYFNKIFEGSAKVLNVNIIPKFPIQETKIQKENELYLANKNELALRFFNPTLNEIPKIDPSCGHAIVTFNSSKAVQTSILLSRSNFQCFYSTTVQDELRIEDLGLKIYEAPDQQDILYLYLNTSFQHMIFRRILIQIVLILILLFFTTPASIIELIGLDKNKISYNEDGALIKQYISLTLLIALNSGLLKVIEYSCRLEQPVSKSQYQISLFSRSVFYLTINMFIIPAISFLAANSLYKILMEGATNLISAIQAAYFLLNGKFFMGIILQAGFVSFISLLRLDEIFSNHLSVFYTTLKRQHYKFNSYLQPLEDMFTFGYYYSLQIAILYIIITFGINVPLIYFAGIFFTGCRLFADNLSLLSVFGQEIKSNNNLILVVLQNLLYTLYPKLIINFIMFGLQLNLMYTILTVIQIFIYTICVIKLNHNVQDDYFDFRIEQVKDFKIYDHPF